MPFYVTIEPRSSRVPGTLYYATENDLISFLVDYIKEYFPTYVFKTKTNFMNKLCKIQKLSDDKFKVLEIVKKPDVPVDPFNPGDPIDIDDPSRLS